MNRDPSPSTAAPDALVLLHGWGMNGAVWGGLAEPGALGLRPYPLELPGHGGQAFHTGQQDLWGWADACLAAAPQRAVWVGWSLGGLVALAAALRAPKRVAALVLLTTTPRFVQAADWTPAMPEATLNGFHTALLQDPQGTLARFLGLQVRGSASARDTLRQLRQRLEERPPPGPAALALGLDLLRESDLRGRLADIRCPALWLFGSHDGLVPPAVAERVELLMPGAHTRVLPGAAHAPHLSHPEATTRALSGFLAEIETAAGPDDEASAGTAS